MFNGLPAGIISWSDTQIVATVPSYATSGPAAITTSLGTSNSIGFTVPVPVVSNINPTGGIIGTQVTVNGGGFGSAQGTALSTSTALPLLLSVGATRKSLPLCPPARRLALS